MTAVVVTEAVAIGILALVVTGILRTQAETLRVLRDRQQDRAPAAPTGPPLAGHPAVPAAYPAVPAAHPVVPAAHPVVPGPAPVALARRGSPAADLVGVDTAGQPVHVAAGDRLVLAFLTSGCRSCSWWWSQLRAAGSTVLPGLVVVTPDPAMDAAADVAALAGGHLRVVMSSDTWADYGVQAGATFVVVEARMVRAAGPAANWDELVALAGVAEAGVAETGVAETGVAETGVAETGLAEAAPPAG